MKPDPQADIRAAFKRRRERLGLSGHAMAKLLGMAQSRYHGIENSATVRLTPEIRAQLDKALSELEAEMRRQTG
jgi:transcriptional regulator with XRE-family HTH domain